MVGFATNAQWFVNRKDTMKMGTAMLVPTEGGDLDLTYATLKWVNDLVLVRIKDFFSTILFIEDNYMVLWVVMTGPAGEWPTWQRKTIL